MCEDHVSYIMSRLGCAHPFKISRILLLADWLAEERLGRKLTSFTYVKERFGFYIEEIPSIMEDLRDRGCAVKIEERKCFEYRCEEPGLPKEEKEVLDEVILKVRGLSDVELNKLVISDPRYKGESS